MIYMRIVIFTFIFAIAFDLYSKCKFKNVIKSDEVEYTIQNSIDVNDQDGHVIRIFKTETSHLNPKKIVKD